MIKVCVTVSVRSVTSGLWKLCFVGAVATVVRVYVCGKLTSASFHLVSGLNIHDSSSLLLLTSTANSLQLLIPDQQESSSQRSREEQLLRLQSHTLIARQNKFS